MQPLLIDLTRRGADADFSLMPELFPPGPRPHVVVFGRFVRLADDVAASPWLARQDKIARLEVLEASLYDAVDVRWSDDARHVADTLRRCLRESGVTPDHAAHIVRSFRQDVIGIQVQTWDDLLLYCRGAAAPIGRYMLDLLGEDPGLCGTATDALCAALLILKRLRDFRSPAGHNRLCIPRRFMDDALVSPQHLRAPSAKGQTRAVIDRVLDGGDHLLDTAAALPPLIRSEGLRLHTAIVLCRGRKLAARFREQDPLQVRVSLSRWQRTRCRWSALVPALLRPA